MNRLRCKTYFFFFFELPCMQQEHLSRLILSTAKSRHRENKKEWMRSNKQKQTTLSGTESTRMPVRAAKTHASFTGTEERSARRKVFIVYIRIVTEPQAAAAKDYTIHRPSITFGSMCRTRQSRCIASARSSISRQKGTQMSSESTDDAQPETRTNRPSNYLP